MFSALLCLVAGCRQESTFTPDAGAPGAIAAAPRVHPAPSVELRVDDTSVATYVQYLRALKARPAASPPATGAQRGALAALEDEARAEDAALAAAGLSEEQLGRIEPVVQAVLARRRLARAAGLDEAIAGYRALEAKVPEARKQTLRILIAELEERRTAMGSLAAEEERFGKVAVAAVLARAEDLESELTTGR